MKVSVSSPVLSLHGDILCVDDNHMVTHITLTHKIAKVNMMSIKKKSMSFKPEDNYIHGGPLLNSH